MARARNENGLVRYRYARSSDGSFVNISDYRPGEQVHCIGCDRSMLARQGKVKQWHFAHRADLVHSCSAETVLHRLGKSFIKEGFERALAEQRPFNLSWPCPRCRTPTVRDCTEWCERVEVEGSPTAGVRSDLILHGTTPCVIEIVVTHDLDEETAKAYANARLPVFIVRPNWDSVSELRKGISAHELRFATTTNCPGCLSLDELAKQQDIAGFLARLRKELEASPRFLASMKNVARWSMRSDQRGKDLAPEVQQTLRAHAKTLVRLGFAPLPRKLTLNRYLQSAGNLYAVLRGSLKVPISDDPRPIFFLELHTRIIGEDARAAIRDELRAHLMRLDVPFRDVYVSPESAQAEYLLLPSKR